MPDGFVEVEKPVEYTLGQAAELLEEWLGKYQNTPGAWEELEAKTGAFLFQHDLAGHGVISIDRDKHRKEETQALWRPAAAVGRHRKPGKTV